jgi:hypothetical protein
MAGLLGLDPYSLPKDDPLSRERTMLPHNVSVQELLQFLLQRGGLLGLGGIADALTPVDPMTRQPLERTIKTRKEAMDEQLRY